MYSSFFKAVKTAIKRQLNDSVEVDYFNNQYYNYENLNVVKFPAVYVELGNIVWQDASQGLKISEHGITLHVVSNDLSASPHNAIAVAENIADILQGHSLFNEEQKKISTGMTLTEIELLTQYSQIKVMRVTLKTTLFYRKEQNKKTISLKGPVITVSRD